jgi:hypothetical protein
MANSSRFSNSSAAAQRARDLHNAKITNSRPAPRSSSKVPSPADKPLVLPKVASVPLPVDPHLPRRK